MDISIDFVYSRAPIERKTQKTTPNITTTTKNSILSVMVRLQAALESTGVRRGDDAARAKRSYMATGYCGARKTVYSN